MSDVENARAQAEALNEPATRALRSARRAQLWAGLNRYLVSEAAHAKRAEDLEKESEKEAEKEPGAESESKKVPRQPTPRSQDRE